ncbi:MOSC N-terminal beta barrel domain-containing protein [Alphaproteobacteria bacterium]|nr:MOSC N-terminal beta barrel domain-containing protein [Alphaproteobacteria bacterium]MDB2477370.1 MOSC N-terminal beta barrel domain-containing protein [Alphaproteobacteria bacterium]
MPKDEVSTHGAIIVTEIWRYPVKSMMGERLRETGLGENGIPGDRAWAVRDEKRGGIRGAKKIPQLMDMQATSQDDAPLITARDGQSARANETDIHSWLSEKLDHPVSLWPLVPAEQLEHYRRGAPDSDDPLEEFRNVMGRLPGETLPDFSDMPELLEFESPPGTYFDAFPVLLLSQQSLNTMNALYEESIFDVRRFRPNILLDFTGSDAPFPDQSLIGKTVTIGTVELEIVSTCPRCSMTTHAFADLPKDTKIMRRLVEKTDGNLGVYASIKKPGQIKEADRLWLQTN